MLCVAVGAIRKSGPGVTRLRKTIIQAITSARTLRLFLVAACALAIISGVLFLSARGPRIGAVARDGWVSSATGRGACSWHGGVAHWIYGPWDSDLVAVATAVLIAGILAALLALACWRRRHRLFSQSWPAHLIHAEDILGLSGKPVSAPSHIVNPQERVCPRCGSALVLRHRKRDWHPFLGCRAFPRCRYTRDDPPTSNF